MLITTSETLHDRQIRHTLGMVQGSSIKARHAGKDIAAGFRSLIGGEINVYRKLMEDSRDQAFSIMEERAAELGADAIIAVRITTASLMNGAAEILVYGTAVRTKRIGPIWRCSAANCNKEICMRCGECPKNCGFGEGETSPHAECRTIKSVMWDEVGEECKEASGGKA